MIPLAVYVYVEVAEGASKPVLGVSVYGLFVVLVQTIIAWPWVSFSGGYCYSKRSDDLDV